MGKKESKRETKQYKKWRKKVKRIWAYARAENGVRRVPALDTFTDDDLLHGWWDAGASPMSAAFDMLLYVYTKVK